MPGTESPGIYLDWQATLLSERLVRNQKNIIPSFGYTPQLISITLPHIPFNLAHCTDLCIFCVDFACAARTHVI
jgi:hypothetical protein